VLPPCEDALLRNISSNTNVLSDPAIYIAIPNQSLARNSC
jgi:hypothetical protein